MCRFERRMEWIEKYTKIKRSWFNRNWCNLRYLELALELAIALLSIGIQLWTWRLKYIFYFMKKNRGTWSKNYLINSKVLLRSWKGKFKLSINEDFQMKYYPSHSSFKKRKTVNQFLQRLQQCFRHYKPLLNWPR